MKRQKKAATADEPSSQKKDPKKPGLIKKQTSLSSFITITKKNPEKEQKQIQGKLGTGIFRNNSDTENENTKQEIKISSWNVNGIRAILQKNDYQDNLKEGIINYIEHENPDIFCINESKIDQSMYELQNVAEKIPFIQNKKYYDFWNFCKPPKKGYSGVAIFTKVPPISVVNDMGIEKHDNEGRLITAEFNNFYLCAVYVPNAGQGLVRLDYRTQEWDTDFQNYLNELRKKKSVILCGDLNVAHNEIDLANPKTNQKTAGFTIQERKSFSKFLEQGWIDTFRDFYPDTVKYSYFSMRTGGRAKNTGWRLDYYVVNKEFLDQVVDSEINNDYFGSDHTPIELTLKNQDCTIIQEESQENENENQ